LVKEMSVVEKSANSFFAQPAVGKAPESPNLAHAANAPDAGPVAGVAAPNPRDESAVEATFPHAADYRAADAGAAGAADAGAAGAADAGAAGAADAVQLAAPNPRDESAVEATFLYAADEPTSEAEAGDAPSGHPTEEDLAYHEFAYQPRRTAGGTAAAVAPQ
jgi:hypothetical protein